ncbi:LysE family translocator [Staphylococcus xylosus]|nr:LysE family translocator [Staphylococcus xylosus]
MNILSFLFYTFLVTATPGPTNIDILNTIKSKGRPAGVKYTYGAIIAFIVLLVISTILNTLLSQIMPSILFIMKFIGSLYMLYLVYTLFKIHNNNESNKNIGSFKSGFTLQFLNPKVITFTMTVIPTFVLKNYNSIFTISIFVIIISIIALFSFSLWVLFGLLLQSFLQRYELLVNMIMAIFLIYAAIMVWI